MQFYVRSDMAYRILNKQQKNMLKKVAPSNELRAIFRLVNAVVCFC